MQRATDGARHNFAARQPARRAAPPLPSPPTPAQRHDEQPHEVFYDDDGDDDAAIGDAVRLVPDLANSPAALDEIKNTVDNNVVRTTLIRACEGCQDKLDLDVLFYRDRYVLVLRNFVERISLDYLESIRALNDEQYSSYNPIEAVWIDFKNQVLNIEVRKIECTNKVALQQMLLVDRDTYDGGGAQYGGGDQRGAGAQHGGGGGGGGGTRSYRGGGGYHGGQVRSRSRSRSPPRRGILSSAISSVSSLLLGSE